MIDFSRIPSWDNSEGSKISIAKRLRIGALLLEKISNPSPEKGVLDR